MAQQSYQSLNSALTKYRQFSKIVWLSELRQIFNRFLTLSLLLLLTTLLLSALSALEADILDDLIVFIIKIKSIAILLKFWVKRQ